MIEDEVLAILSNDDDEQAAGHLNSLVDQFREGRNPADVLTILYSENSDLVRIGAMIVNEISFERYNTDSFICRLRELTNDDNPAIRFYALGALYPSFDPANQDTRDLITKLLEDVNEGVRLRATAAAKSLGMD